MFQFEKMSDCIVHSKISNVLELSKNGLSSYAYHTSKPNKLEIACFVKHLDASSAYEGVYLLEDFSGTLKASCVRSNTQAFTMLVTA